MMFYVLVVVLAKLDLGGNWWKILYVFKEFEKLIRLNSWNSVNNIYLINTIRPLIDLICVNRSARLIEKLIQNCRVKLLTS